MADQRLDVARHPNLIVLTRLKCNIEDVLAFWNNVCLIKLFFNVK